MFKQQDENIQWFDMNRKTHLINVNNYMVNQ